jgi:TonB family protein
LESQSARDPGWDSLPANFAGYTLLARIARTPRASLYCASTNSAAQPRLVALKRMTAELSRDRALKARFLEAGEQARQLVHPGLCRIHEVGEAHGTLFVAMEMIAGIDLARVRTCLGALGLRMPADCAAWVMSRVASALCEAQTRNGPRWTDLSHGNLVASNISITFDGAVKVTDFALSAALGSGSGEHSDAAALGRCLLELLAGEDAVAQPASAAPGQPRNFSEHSGAQALRSIAMRTLAPKAGAALATPAAVKRALDEFMQARGASATDQNLRGLMRAHFAHERNAILQSLERFAAAAQSSMALGDAGPHRASGVRVRATPELGARSQVTKAPRIRTPPPVRTPPPARTSQARTPQARSAPQARTPSPVHTSGARASQARSSTSAQGQPRDENRAPIARRSDVPRRYPLWWIPLGTVAAALLVAALSFTTTKPVQQTSSAISQAVDALPAEAANSSSARTAPLPSSAPAIETPRLANSPPRQPPLEGAARAPATPPLPGRNLVLSAAKRGTRLTRAQSSRAAIQSREARDAETLVTGDSSAPAGAAVSPARSAEIAPSPSQSNAPAPLPASARLPAPVSAPVPVPVQAAVPLEQEAPRFPARARRRGVRSGNVLIAFVIDPHGSVREPVVVDSQPPGIFDEAALEALAGWRYKPRLRAGTPVESRNMRVRMLFSEAK